MISREVPKNMSGSATYAVQKYTLATMISSATSYDYIMTRNSQRQLISTDSVSYTHLTLPTNREV